MKEDKNRIALAMEELLQTTHFGRDIECITYSQTDDGDENLIVIWENGYTEMINITADSGMAMIIDLAKWLQKK